MSAALAQVWQIEGLWFLAIGAALAGLVRGFSGFGGAMVYMPFAAQVLPPVWVLVTILVIELVGPLSAVPRALRDGHPRDVLRLGLGAVVGIPLGVMILTRLPTEPFRYAVSIITISLLVLLVAGVRYSGRVGRRLTLGTGLISGLFGGAVGLPGPPVILLYMARPLPAAAIRANVLLFLILGDILMFAVFWASGLLTPQPVLIGLVLMPVYLAALLLGSALFDPARGSVYRWVAYAIIAGSALRGLPVWG